jgi:hypothetical protein
LDTLAVISMALAGSSPLVRPWHRSLPEVQGDAIRGGRQIRCRFPPRRVGLGIAGIGSGGHDRENGQTDACRGNGRELACRMQREEEQAPERQAHDGRRDQAPNPLQVALLTLMDTTSATLSRSAATALAAARQSGANSRRSALAALAPTPPSYR